MPTLLLPIMLVWVPSAKHETQKWDKLFGSRGPTKLWGVGGQFLLAITLGSMAITKLVDRLCKMAIIGNKSTIFFEGVDAGRHRFELITYVLQYPYSTNRPSPK